MTESYALFLAIFYGNVILQNSYSHIPTIKLDTKIRDFTQITSDKISMAFSLISRIIMAKQVNLLQTLYSLHYLNAHSFTQNSTHHYHYLTQTQTTMKSPRPLILLSFLFSTFFLQLHAIPAAAPASYPPDTGSGTGTDFIRTSCNSTLYPEICYSTLSRYASTIQQDPAQLASVAIGVTLSKAKGMANYVSNISRQADYGSDQRAAAALHDCFSNFGDAVEEIYGSVKQMRQIRSAGTSRASFRFQMSNVQTWMSAALTDEETCTDGFEDVADGQMKEEVCDRVEYVKKLTSNALALVNRYAENGMN